MGSYSQTFHHTAPTHPVEVKTSMAAKMVTILSLVGSALSHPAGPPAPYAAPAPVYAVEPPVYNYQYGVSDDYSGSVFSAQENRNNYDTAGEYRVNLPDGRVQVVSYSAGPEGYVADVQYEGVAAYPDTKPYVPAPAYKAAPVVRIAPVAVAQAYAPAPVVVAKPYVTAPVVVAAPYKPVYHAAPAYHATPVVYSQPSGYAPSPINPAYTPKKYGFTIQEEEAPAAKEAAEESDDEEAAPTEEAPEEAAVEEA